MRFFSFLCACAALWTLFNHAARAEQAGNKHITVPFKTEKMGPWTTDGSSFTMDIEDKQHGKLTLTLRIVRASEATFTLAADGTDYDITYPLPPEAQGSVIVRFKKREFGEPLDTKKGEALVRFLIAAKYFRYAREELAGLADLSEAKRTELTGAILEGRARTFMESAAALMRLGQFEDAGRMLTEAQTAAGEPGQPPEAAERLKAVEKEINNLQVKLTGEAQARSAWRQVVGQIHKALEGAHPEEAAVIDRLMLDLDGPLPGERRTSILKALHANTASGINYGQALELLKEFSFAVRYGEAISRAEIINLDDFFDAERAIDLYLNGDEKDAAARLEKVLAIKGLTDRAFETLVRHGHRAPPPPKASEGRSPQGPFSIDAPAAELEVGLKYMVMLPVDYHPSQRRPLLLALHGTNADAAAATQLWAADALKRGWIVAAPECVIGRGKGYLSTPDERGLGLRTIADCMRRFAVDPNRVYVAGHSMGGQMAWDLALTYPGRFAAASPFAGCVNGVSSNYVPNSFHVPVYCVSGERDLITTKVNRLVNEDLKRQKRPMMYVEYLQRGNEGFAEEIPKVVDWMSAKVRPRSPKEVDFVSADMETSQVFWLAMSDNQTKKDKAATTYETAVRGAGIARLSGSITASNTVDIKAFNITGLKIFVNQELFDLAKPLKVTINNHPVKPVAFEVSRKRLLEIARQSGDRERLYWAAADVPVPK